MKNKASGRKRIIAAAAAVIIVGGGAAIAAFSAPSGQETEASFREYTVSKGDITVGAEESGTVSIERAYVSLPFSAEVTEVYVKEGVSVKSGDPLMKLSEEDIAEAKEELESAVYAAKLELEAAKSNEQLKGLEAKQTLEKTIENGNTAETDYELYISKNASEKESRIKKLSELKSELQEYTAMQETYPEDYSALQAYENTLEEYEESYKAMEKKYREYSGIDSDNSAVLENIQTEYDEYIESVSDKSSEIEKRKKRYEEAKSVYDKALEEFETAKENYENASSDSIVNSSDTSSEQSGNSSQNSSADSSSSNSNNQSLLKKYNEAKTALDEASAEYNSANVAYSGYYQSLDKTISDKIAEFEERIKEAEKTAKAHEKITRSYKTEMDSYNQEISDYRELCEEKRSEFTEIYGQNDDESIAYRIEELTANIREAELSESEASASENGNILNARQQADTAIAQADSAQSEYERTVASLERNTQNAQKAYDKACEQYEELCEAITDGGIVYAECDGIVSAVNVSEGDSIMSGMNAVTLMDTRYIYLSASISEEDITSLTQGMDCSVSLTAFEGRSFDGYIDTISAEPARSSGSVTYTVTVKLRDESGLNVREGMSGDITFIEGGVSDVLYTNVNAVTFKDGVSYVRMYDENGSVIQKEVVTGFTDGRYVEISEGVSAGDKVLAEIELSGTAKQQSRKD